MSSKFFALNQVLSANISSSSENALFPISNIKHPHRTKTFRTTSGSGWVTFDFGEAVPINSFLIVDNNGTGFNLNSLTFKVNGSDTWGSPLFSSSVTLDSEFGFGSVLMTSTITARYARIEFSSLDSFCEISKIFIGAKAEILTDVTYPIDFEQNSLSRVAKNRYGQRFIDEVISQKILGVNFAYLTKDEMDAVFECLDFCSITRPIWVMFETVEITNNNNRINGYYYLTDDPKMQYVSGNFWNLALSLEEGT